MIIVVYQALKGMWGNPDEMELYEHVAETQLKRSAHSSLLEAFV